MPTFDRLEFPGSSGPIGNTFLRQGGSRVGVVLPGFLGGWTTPAVYYPVLALLDRNHDVLCLDSIYKEHPDVGRLRDDAAAAVCTAQGAGQYSQTTLVGKSLGTLAMTELLLEGIVPPTTSTIWLTPLVKNNRVKSAIDGLSAKALFVIGTEDPHYDADILDQLGRSGHSSLVLANANHGLAVNGSASASAEIPAQLVQAVLDYLDRG